MSLFRRRGVFTRGSSAAGGGMLLSPPSRVGFLISLVLAVIAILIRYARIDIPIIESAYVFEVLLLAYAVLAISVMAGGRYGGRF